MAPEGGGRMKNNDNGKILSLARSNMNGGTRQVLKKGPWTATEDAILTEYVKKNGEGNWNAVQRNCGLMRCGKSCRLRWANHLRPNLKKGAFSLEEERLIVELHAKLGNKWARMAAQMPGRTDNEIKNYWNTRLKRRQRSGLPIYPQDIQPQNHQENNNNPFTFDHHQNYNNTPLSFLDIFNPSTIKPSNTTTNNISHQYQFNNIPSSQYLTTTNNNHHHNNQLNLFRDPRVSLSLTLASSIRNSQLSPMVAPMPKNFGQGLSNSMQGAPPLQHDYLNFGTTDTKPFSGISSNPNGLILGMGAERPSGRSSMPETTTSSSNADSYALDHGLSRRNSTGLLEDLLVESHTITRNEKIGENSCNVENEKDKSIWEECGLTEEAADAILTEESLYNFAQNSEDSSPINSSSGITTKETSLEVANQDQVDDDIMRFLDNFQVPDWSCDDVQSFECDQMQSQSSKSS